MLCTSPWLLPWSWIPFLSNSRWSFLYSAFRVTGPCVSILLCSYICGYSIPYTVLVLDGPHLSLYTYRFCFSTWASPSSLLSLSVQSIYAKLFVYYKSASLWRWFFLTSSPLGHDSHFSFFVSWMVTFNCAMAIVGDACSLLNSVDFI